MPRLTELLNEIGDENLSFQTLHQSVTGAAKKRNGDTEVKFVATGIRPGDLYGRLKKTAVIVWMDADKFDAALLSLQNKAD